MNKTEAHELITVELAKYRKWSYDQLRALVDAPKRSCEVVGASGMRYYIDIDAHWDATAEGPIRVMGWIDDGGWGAYVPMTHSFIKAPDGSFVGETSHSP